MKKIFAFTSAVALLTSISATAFAGATLEAVKKKASSNAVSTPVYLVLPVPMTRARGEVLMLMSVVLQQLRFSAMQVKYSTHR